MLAPIVNSEFRNDNSDENIEASDVGSDVDNNDDDDTTPTSGNNDEDTPAKDDPDLEPSSDDTKPNDNDSSTPTDDAHAWSYLVDDDDDDDDVDNDRGDFDWFCSDYDLDDDGVFDNNEIGEREGFCCMTVTKSWDPQVDDYKENNILLQHGAFATGGNPIIHPNYFHGTLNNSIGQPYTNEGPFSKTNVLHHALLKSSLRIHRGDIMKSIEHYDALWWKFQRIRIHNSTDYFNLDSSSFLQLLLTSQGLSLLYSSTIESIKLELIFALQIQQSNQPGNLIKEVWNIDTDTYNEEFDNNGNVNLLNICLHTQNLQQKSFPNNWPTRWCEKLRGQECSTLPNWKTISSTRLLTHVLKMLAIVVSIKLGNRIPQLDQWKQGFLLRGEQQCLFSIPFKQWIPRLCKNHDLAWHSKDICSCYVLSSLSLWEAAVWFWLLRFCLWRR